MEIDKKIEEYKEAGALHRLHITLMFGQMTVYLAASAGLIQVLTKEVPPLIPVQIVLSLIGIALSIIFWIVTERAAKFLHSARNRAMEIEKQLELSLYSSGPSRENSVLTATNATRLLYLSGILGWFSLLIIKVFCR